MSHALRTSTLCMVLTVVCTVGFVPKLLSASNEVWWAFKPVERPALPVVHDRQWPRNAIDTFALAKLEQENLQPSPPATERTLIRRLYFDLIGLPPSPEQVERFVADPQIYSQIVEELLASPSYGERWGRHWLDVARFGESDGFERNNARETLWPYRDWVIEALNRDLPYDQFTRQQLASDLLVTNRAKATERLAPLGFLVAGVHNTVVGASDFMQKTARQDELEEVAAAVGQTFLGLTVHCARCHDHKFDPISSLEYYRFISCLSGIHHGEEEYTDNDVTMEASLVEKRIRELKEELRRIEQPARAALGVAQGDRPTPPTAIARWDFEHDLQDSLGSAHGTAFGSAHIEDGGLVLDGQSYVQTAPLPYDLEEKTIEAWVQLTNWDQQGGGVVSIQAKEGPFDAIVFAEREVKRWMAGSDFFNRSQSFEGAMEVSDQPVHIAIAYSRDGRIRAFRNGEPYGKSYQTAVQSFRSGEYSLFFGLRHLPPGGNRFFSGRILRAQLYDRALDAQEIAASAAAFGQQPIAEELILQHLEKDECERRGVAKTELKRLEGSLPALHKATRRTIYTAAGPKAELIQVLTRGDVRQPAATVRPGGLSALAELKADFGLPPDAPDQERRRQLAEWITDARNPLFPRVMVNRLWHYHFGRGLVETPSDFGVNGGRPSHPQLLDWLAAEFMARGYSLKAVHRLIVNSSTYRQSSASRPEGMAPDADNRWLWRHSPARLDAESLRDALLQVAGKLDHTMGGAGFKDVQVEYLNGTTYYTPLDTVDPGICRRTVYRFSPRGNRSALLDTFDCPDPSAAAPRRSSTTTPLQALALWNSALVLRMSDALAERVRTETDTEVPAQIQRSYQLVYGRAPTEQEANLCLRFVREHGLAALARVLVNGNEFVLIQ